MTTEKNIEVTGLFFKNNNAKERYVINVGGARSSKSYSIAQLYITKFFKESGKDFLVTRKTMPSLRATAYRLVIDLLKEYGLYNQCQHNKSENILTFRNNYMLFTGIDDPEKIKSTKWNYIWLEEANEFTYDDFIILETRLSGQKKENERNQIFFSLNPVDEFSWINQKIIINPHYNKNGKLRVIQSTYKDNPFLDKDYIDLLEGLKNEDPNYWRIFGLGEWGKIENIIYQPYSIEVDYPDSFRDFYYGLDFGYNNPSCLIGIGEKDEELWLHELLYQSRITNQELIEKLKLLIPQEMRSKPIYADSSEPNRIEEIYRAGFNVKPSEKSIKDGLDYCRRQKFHSRADNVNINKERQSYKYREDKNGNIIDDPVKFMDHALDAIRYAVYTHNKSKREVRITVIS